MRALVRLVGLALWASLTVGCECGASDAEPSAEAPTATGRELALPDSVSLAPEALAALEGASDGSRSNRRPGVASPSLLVRVPPERGAIVASTLDGLTVWEADVGRLHPGAFVQDGAVVVRGRTFAPSGEIQPTLTAVELSSGAVRWQHRDSEALHFGVPAGAGREIYAMRIAPDRCLGVAVVDARTGEANDPIETACLRFVSTAPLELWEPSIQPDGEGAVVLGRSEGRGYALVSLGIDGNARWRVEAALGTQAPLAPVVLSGAVLALDRGVRALDRETGDVFWRVEMTAREMAVSEGRVFVTEGNAVRSLDASDGETRFSVSLPGPARSPRAHGDLLLVETAAGLHAFSALDGEARWVHEPRGGISSVALTEDAVFVATSREVTRLDRHTGEASVFAEAGGQHLIAVVAPRNP